MIDDIKKTSQIKALELAQAKEIFAQYYKDTLTRLEESPDPLSLTKGIVNAQHNHGILEEERRLLFSHQEDRLTLHQNHQEQLKMLSANNLNLPEDRLNAVIERHNKEVNMLTFLQEGQLAELDHVSDYDVDAVKDRVMEFILQPPLLAFDHIEPNDLQPQANSQSAEKPFQQTHLSHKDDLDKAMRLLAAKELNDHHREEIETLNERQKNNPDHEQDLNALLALHAIEEKAFQQSHNPLEETRAVINDSNHFNSFEDYAASRLQEAKSITTMYEQVKEPKNTIEFDDETFLRGHLQQASEQKAFDNIEAPPSLYESYFADNEKWPKEMFVEGSFVQYGEFDNAEHHSMDWQQHNFSQHHIALEVQQGNELTQDNGFGIEQ